MGFWDVLSEFLKSDFAKNNISQIIALQIAIIFITGLIVSLFFNKIIIPVKLKRSDYIILEYKEALKKIEFLESKNKELKAENEIYRKQKKMENALNSDGLQEEFDEGLGKFLKN